MKANNRISTPFVSAPKEEDADSIGSSEKKSVSSVLFMDPAKIPAAVSTPNRRMGSIAASSPVIPMGSATGTSQGAALLVEGTGRQPMPQPSPQVPDDRFRGALEGYSRTWRAAAAEISMR